ncbi:uncharacterized membrane protein YgdD (TMEM256/DUF423 family) [Salirhabdus euzebyi]|uniref:Uncharacterized membrane protein YgdD (TMEM256/DUF423 family) n=1 Tax=Salirhabdus euzebyi TaxID=394506 RepID=A0A841Q1Z2_9BACI|nr:DUF3784 domain-containing protein [Salirhabdus euzebyi]MBB6452513.1 uncharacterized membrane protein YgdD (TMEM256/DUF423 family) [Salirhabdus euzebyi]
MIGTIIVIVLFIVFGIFLSVGKGAFLIAGYNTMPKEEKEKYDTVALCKFMGKMMFVLSFSMVFWVLSDLLEKVWLFVLGIVLFITTVIFILFYTNTGNRFRKK